MASKEYDMDKYLQDVDAGKQASTLGKQRQEMPTQPVVRPNSPGGIFTMPPAPSPKPPSKAPYGMDACVKGDIGKYRQQEAEKVFRKGLGGRSISNPLKYRTPDTAIDAKYGPGDEVC